MSAIPKMKPKIAAFSALILLLSILRIAYEFHSAQHSIDHLADSTDSRVPSLPHLSDHSPPYPSSLPVDLRTTLSLSSILRTVSTKRRDSGVGDSDMKIDNDNTRYRGHAQQGRAPMSIVAPRTVSVSPAESASRVPVRRMSTLPSLVIVVCSKPENTEFRLAIRKSWGLEVDDSKVMLRFFVGQDDDWDKIIIREQDLHGDVIITDFMDTYENLSYKVLTAISWTLQNVKSVQHVMKIDDDTYVNLPFLLSELRDNNVIKDAATQLYVIGAVCVNSSVIREEGDKWFVSRLDYPSDVYPTYVFGGGYVLTKAAAVSILAARAKADYLHLEDVFVTGVLAKAAGVHHLAHPGFVFWTSKRPSPCDMVSGRRLTAVNMTSKQFYVMYSGIHAILRVGNWTAC